MLACPQASNDYFLNSAASCACSNAVQAEYFNDLLRECLESIFLPILMSLSTEVMRKSSASIGRHNNACIFSAQCYRWPRILNRWSFSP